MHTSLALGRAGRRLFRKIGQSKLSKNPHASSTRVLQLESLEPRRLLSASPTGDETVLTAAALGLEYEFEVVAKAEPDEWYNGIGGPYVPLGEQSPGDPGRPKVNQDYVWATTQTGADIWFASGGNVLCQASSVIGSAGSEGYEDGIHVTEGAQSQYPSGIPDDLKMFLGDWRPPEIHRYNTLTNTYEEMTPDDPLLDSTLGLRSAGANDEIVLLAGPNLYYLGMNVFAFNAQTGEYLGSDRIFRYSDIRRWENVEGQLYTSVLRTFSTSGEGAVLRWSGSLADPFDFTEVGRLDLEGANICYHEGRLYVSTWPLNYGSLMGVLGYRSEATAGIWMSPELGDDGLSWGDSWSWEKVWDIGQYEPDPVIAQSYGGGAMESFDGYLYWGTMQVPYTGTVAFSEAYPEVDASDVWDKTNRPLALFRVDSFAEPAADNVELLYGDNRLWTFTHTGGSGGYWTKVANSTGSPLFGQAGFDNDYNTYTWSMAAYDNRLYVGTFDYTTVMLGDAYVSFNGNLDAIEQYLASTYLLFDVRMGADLWCFLPDDNGTPVEPFAVSREGAGNPLNHGIRNMESTPNGLYLGSASASNLLTAPYNPPSNPLHAGGWELIRVDISGGSRMELSSDTVEENSGLGTAVGTLSVVPGGTYTYTLLDNADGRFRIEGNEIQVNDGSLLDYESLTTHTVTVQASNGTGQPLNQSFLISVTDVNEAPVDMGLSDNSVVEHVADGTVMGTLSADDPDAGDTHDYVLLDDAGGRFQIVEDELRVADGSLLDFATAFSHNISVRAVDSGGLAFDKVFTIIVQPSNTLTSIDVQEGALQRSFIRYVDLYFASGAGLDDLVAENRVQLTRFELDGSGGALVDLDGVLGVNGSRVRFDFSEYGIGGSRSSRSGNGYYEIGVDLDGNGTFEAKRHFYRLLGDVNGDRTVDTLDRNLVFAALGQSGSQLEADADGSGTVSIWDWYLTLVNSSRGLDPSLPLDD